MSEAWSTSLKSLLREISLEAVRHQLKLQSAQIQELPSEKIILGHWMSLALLASSEMRVIFKVHFNTSALPDGIRIPKAEDSKTTVRLMQDLMNEYCNLVIGLLKRSLLRSGLGAGVSLPVALRGFDEVYFANEEGQALKLDRWCIDSTDFSFCCSVQFEFLDASKLQEIDFDFSVKGIVGNSELEWFDQSQDMLPQTSPHEEAKPCL